MTLTRFAAVSLLVNLPVGGQMIREERTVQIRNATETWRLEWQTPPRPYCESGNRNWWATHPCSGFAFGEIGQLNLVRLRDGQEVDHLPIAPLFRSDFKGAVLQRWAPATGDFDIGDEDLPKKVRTRPLVQLMHFRDYDHDGLATEFFLETEPQLREGGVVIGLRGTSNRLQVFGTARSATEPLLLPRHEWELLRNAKVPIDTLYSACGAYGSDREIRHLLNATPVGIVVTERTYECTGSGRGRLLKTVVR